MRESTWVYICLSAHMFISELHKQLCFSSRAEKQKVGRSLKETWQVGKTSQR